MPGAQDEGWSWSWSLDGGVVPVPKVDEYSLPDHQRSGDDLESRLKKMGLRIDLGNEASASETEPAT